MPERPGILTDADFSPEELIDSSQYDTQLLPDEEESFKLWKKEYAPEDVGFDYDYRGAFKAGVKPDENMHWPDTFKKPSHPTFSTDSAYAKDRPDLAGQWVGETYLPPGEIQLTDEDVAAEKLPVTTLKERESAVKDVFKVRGQDLLHKPLLGHILQDVPRAVSEEVKGADPLGAAKEFVKASPRLWPELKSAFIKLQGKGSADALDKSKILGESQLAGQAHLRKTQGDERSILPFVPIKKSDIAQLPENMAYSLASMGTGLAVGVPIAFAPVPGARPVAWLTGTAASGAAAYQMSTYSIMQSFLEVANEKSIAETGQEITPEKQEELRAEFDKLASQYGLWEAVPEALSNLAFATIIGGPLTKVLSNMGMKGAGAKILTKVGALYGEELLTETITQKGQAPIEEKGGIREKGTGDLTWWQALKEVAPQTFLLTTVLGGTGATVVEAKTRIYKSLKKEVGQKKADELMKKVDAELQEGESFEQQLDSQAEQYGQKVHDIILKQFEEAEGVPGVKVEVEQKEEAVPGVVQPEPEVPGVGKVEPEVVPEVDLVAKMKETLAIYQEGGIAGDPAELLAQAGYTPEQIKVYEDQYQVKIPGTEEAPGVLTDADIVPEEVVPGVEATVYPEEASVDINNEIVGLKREQQILGRRKKKTAKDRKRLKAIPGEIKTLEKKLSDLKKAKTKEFFTKKAKGKVSSGFKKTVQDKVDQGFISKEEANDIVAGVSETEVTPSKKGTYTVYQGRGKEVEEIYRGVAKPVLGDGKYYAFTKHEASLYGDDIAEATVTPENALVIKTDDQWRALTKAAGWRFPNNFGLPEDEISQNIDDLKMYILSKGHDAVIIKLAKDDSTKNLRNIFGIDQLVDYTGFEDKFSPPMKVNKTVQELNNIDQAIHDEKMRIDSAERLLLKGKMTRAEADTFIRESEAQIKNLQEIRAKVQERSEAEAQTPPSPESVQKQRQEIADPVIIEKSTARAVYKIKIDAEWKMPFGKVKPKEKGVGAYDSERIGDPKYKKINANDVQQALQSQLDDIQIDSETINGAEYVVISGIPKAGKQKVTGKLKNFFASKGSTSIDSAEIIRMIEGYGQPFKLSEAISNLVKRYVNNYGEGYTPRGTVGVFFHDTGNVFMRAMNDIYTAVHEVTHAIDYAAKVVQPIYTPVGFASNGNPKYDPKTRPIRKEFTEVYTKYYPGGKKDHKLSKRINEGYAVFISRAIAYPTQTAEEFPALSKAFLTKEGEYYNPVIDEFMGDARDIIRRYQMLSDQEKIKSRITEVKKEVGTKFLNPLERLLQEFIDDIFFAEKMGRKAGVQWTEKDVSLFMRFYRVLPNILQHNVGNVPFTMRMMRKALDFAQTALDAKDTGMFEKFQTLVGAESFISLDANGQPTEIYDFNWKTLMDSIQDPEDFDGFLVSRLTKFGYDRLDNLEQQAVLAEAALKSLANDLKLGLITKTEYRNAVQDQQSVLDSYDRLRDYLKNNGIDRGVAERAYKEWAPQYQKQADMFDKLKRADWDLKHHPLVQLIDDKTYQLGLENKGYATLFREFENEVAGTPTINTTPRGSRKIRSLKARTGGMQDIRGPLHNSIADHYDSFKKSWQQLVYNKLLNIIPAFPDMFQPVPLEPSYNPFTKRVSYPQEQETDIIMLRKNYKRYPVVVNKDIKLLINEVFTPLNTDWLSQSLLAFTGTFVKGTTGWNPVFAAKNFSQDQHSAFLNTKTNLKPLLSPLKQIYKYLINTDSAQGAYAREYFTYAGGSHTFISLQYMEPEEAYKYMKKEKRGLEQFSQQLQEVGDNIGDVLATPVRTSELVTRMSEYVRARMSGDPVVVALEKAGRVSISFHHRGRYFRSNVVRTGVRAIPYFPARLQIMAQTARTLSRKETRQRAAFVYGLYTATIVGSALYFMGTASDEQKRLYKEIPVEEKSNYIWWPNEDGKTFGRMSVPSEHALIAALINMNIEDKLINANYTPEEYIAQLTTFLPDQLNATNPERAFFSWIPQAVRPLASVGLNKRFWPEVSTLVPEYMKNKPPEDRFFLSTSPLAKEWGQHPLFRNANLSPIEIDALLGGYFGTGTRLITGQKVNNPFRKEVYFSSSRDVRFYYEEKDKLELQKNIEAKDKASIELRRETGRKLAELKSVEQMMRSYSGMVKHKMEKGVDIEEDEQVRSLRRKILDRITAYRTKFY